ncbi:hypothetical protein [Nocardia aurea]|uniref:Uncharacterized protein n=1 Tax=Nocardia aurea TaxID=2144174 RepID=A0ABV3FML4_9NOCA
MPVYIAEALGGGQAQHVIDLVLDSVQVRVDPVRQLFERRRHGHMRQHGLPDPRDGSERHLGIRQDFPRRRRPGRPVEGDDGARLRTRRVLPDPGALDITGGGGCGLHHGRGDLARDIRHRGVGYRDGGIRVVARPLVDELGDQCLVADHHRTELVGDHRDVGSGALVLTGTVYGTGHST